MERADHPDTRRRDRSRGSARNLRISLSGIVLAAGDTTTLNSAPGVVKELPLRRIVGPGSATPGIAASSSAASGVPPSLGFAVPPSLTCAALDVEPVVLLARKREHRLVKGPLDGFQRLLTGLLFFGALLLFDQALEMRFQGLECGDQGSVALIVDDATASTGRQIQERHVDQALHVTRDPRGMIEAG